jgi:hypothetical protein
VGRDFAEITNAAQTALDWLADVFDGTWNLALQFGEASLLLFALRRFQGFGSSVVSVISSGIATRAERSKYMMYSTPGVHNRTSHWSPSWWHSNTST